ncbi:MAG: hypothetical protein N2Z74_09230, partial [Syntrophales bacterium]|nr:hypothetical protein [Syntrophales bacterium]
MMGLKLLSGVQDLLKAVEQATGREIRMIARRDLTVPARLTASEPDDPFLNLYYRAEDDAEAHYAVAVACGHLLRLYQAPPEERLIPVSNRRTMAVYLLECEEEIRRLTDFFGRERARVLVPLWYESVVYQLTTMPTEIMINKWLYDHLHELRHLQLAALHRQRHEAYRSLAPEVRMVTPARIYRAANVMNYVFFKMLEDHFHLDFVAPYHQTVFIFDGTT